MKRERVPGRIVVPLIAGLIVSIAGGGPPLDAADVPEWKHLSSKAGDLPVPNGGSQQTACVVFDVDENGRADIIIAERTKAPSIVWLRSTAEGWKKYVIDAGRDRPEAGGTHHDVDGDGDPDLILGGDAGSSELWWYENPHPDHDPARPWTKRIIKKGGGTAHHDQAVADLDGDGRAELAFWNQNAKKLFIAEIPEDPRAAERWPLHEVFSYGDLKVAKKQEGMDVFDIDGDGKLDLLAGRYWFRHTGGRSFKPIQLAEDGGRIAAGRFKAGKVPQIVIGPGDGNGPLRLLECRGDPAESSSWMARELLDRRVIHGHTLALRDINADGHLDIFAAEMHTPGNKKNCTAWILYGDGRGGFQTTVVSKGIGNHESRIADVNGDGRLDIVGKPYTWDAPRVDVWLNQGTKRSR